MYAIWQLQLARGKSQGVRAGGGVVPARGKQPEQGAESKYTRGRGGAITLTISIRVHLSLFLCAVRGQPFSHSTGWREGSALRTDLLLLRSVNPSPSADKYLPPVVVIVSCGRATCGVKG